MSRSDRVTRYIQFKTQSSFLPATRQSYSLNVGMNDRLQLTRILSHEGGQTATLTAIVDNLDDALDAFEQVPVERQMRISENSVSAFSYMLERIDPAKNSPARLALHFASANVAGLELRIDTSTGGAMPADVRIKLTGKQTPYLRETLANGADIPLVHPAAVNTQTNSDSGFLKNLPDDLLAVLGHQWRPLRYQGDHWKGVLRTLGKETGRTSRAERFIEEAINHIAKTLAIPPTAFHDEWLNARWRVYLRRLQPLMLFAGILALMPLSYFLVSRDELTLHPLALGLTPLLMVGVVVLTAREIPVMEIPPRPQPLPAEYWRVAQ